MEEIIIGGFMALTGIVLYELGYNAYKKTEFLTKFNSIRLNKIFVLTLNLDKETFSLIKDEEIIIQDILNFKDTFGKTYIVSKQQDYVIDKWNNIVVTCYGNTGCSKKAAKIFTELKSEIKKFKSNVL